MEQEVIKGKPQFWKKRDRFEIIKGVTNRFYVRRARFPEGDGPTHVVFRGYRMSVGLLSSKVTATRDMIPKYTYREYAPDEVLEVFFSINEKDEEDVALYLAEYFSSFPEDTDFEFVVPTEEVNKIFKIMRRNMNAKLVENMTVFYELGDTKF